MDINSVNQYHIHMPEKKRQHFVSKFYLKRFSTLGLGKSIGIFNIPSKRLIRSGSLKRQAYKDYFYGSKTDGVEDALSELENQASICLSRIINKKILLKRSIEEYQALLTFIVFLRYRTEYAADENEEIFDKAMKTVLAHDSRVSPYLDNVQMNFDNPSLAALSLVAEYIPLAFDLGAKLIVNDTGRPFITSDNPVVFLNQLYEMRGIRAYSGTGIASKGLQIFFPADPNHYLIFYDLDVYKVGNAGDKIVTITSSEDSGFLNALQILSAYKNLYFNEMTEEKEIRALVNRYTDKRRKKKADVKEYIGEEKDGKMSSLIHMRREDIRIGSEASIIKILKKAKRYEFGNRVVHMRNPEICMLHEKFVALVKEGRYKPVDFGKYLSTQ